MENNKPQLKTRSYSYYDYFEVKNYFKNKYPEFKERKVWQYISDDGIPNNSYFTLSVYQREIVDLLDDKLGRYDDYAYFLQLLIIEFDGEGEYKFYASW